LLGINRNSFHLGILPALSSQATYPPCRPGSVGANFYR
jgi:hypothetical protein